MRMLMKQDDIDDETTFIDELMRTHGTEHSANGLSRRPSLKSAATVVMNELRQSSNSSQEEDLSPPSPKATPIRSNSSLRVRELCLTHTHTHAHSLTPTHIQRERESERDCITCLFQANNMFHVCLPTNVLLLISRLSFVSCAENAFSESNTAASHASRGFLSCPTRFAPSIAWARDWRSYSS